VPPALCTAGIHQTSESASSSLALSQYDER
jgi:hypothetical protein